MKQPFSTVFVTSHMRDNMNYPRESFITFVDISGLKVMFFVLSSSHFLIALGESKDRQPHDACGTTQSSRHLFGIYPHEKKDFGWYLESVGRQNIYPTPRRILAPISPVHLGNQRERKPLHLLRVRNVDFQPADYISLPRIDYLIIGNNTDLVASYKYQRREITNLVDLF